MAIAKFNHKFISIILVEVCLFFLLFLGISPSQALASMYDDHFDGNVFIVYAGNGSLVPAKTTLHDSLKRQIPTVIVYYLDDSPNSKQFAATVSKIQEFYGRAANIIPVTVDSIPVKDTYTKEELGYYYQDVVPQIVILDSHGQKALDVKGQVDYEIIDDALREIFDLLPRSESIELKRLS